MTKNQNTTGTTKRGRSPSYPGISLLEAEKRVQELYNAERTHAAPISAIAEHWGYSPKSSGAKTCLAALRKYGLVECEGSGDERTARLTDLGCDLAIKPDAAAERRKAALLPKFHLQIWEEYGAALPSDGNLRHRLIRNFGFTERGVQEFLSEYKETLEHAGLVNADGQPVGSSEPVDEGSAEHTQAAAAPMGHPPAPDRPISGTATPRLGSMAIPIPLIGEGPVYLSGNFPISGTNWAQLIRVLDAMRPGLVTADETAADKNLPPSASPTHGASGEADEGLLPSSYRESG